MGYHQNDSMVRVDIFRPSGKWYETIAIDMEEFYDHSYAKDAVEIATVKKRGAPLVPGWIYVCTEPYHKNAHPILLIGGK